MRDPGGCGPDGRASTARCRCVRPYPPASPGPRRRTRRRSCRSFERPDQVTQLCCALEVLALHGAVQLPLEAGKSFLLLGERRIGGQVDLAHVLRAAVEPAQQAAQVCLERDVTVRAAETAGLLEVLQRQSAERAGSAARALRAGAAHLGEEVREREAADVHARLEALLRGALVTQMQRLHLVLVDLRVVDAGFPLAAVLAPHA